MECYWFFLVMPLTLWNVIWASLIILRLSIIKLSAVLILASSSILVPIGSIKEIAYPNEIPKKICKKSILEDGLKFKIILEAENKISPKKKEKITSL